MRAAAIGSVALGLVGLGTLFWAVSHRHYEIAQLRASAEAAQLELNKQIVETAESKKLLQESVGNLLSQNAELRAAYESAKRVAPTARVTGVAQLRTEPLPVIQTAPPPEPPQPPDCGSGLPTPDGLGGFRCVAGPTPPAAPVCVLTDQSKLTLTADEIELTTDQGNSVLVGVAKAWRESPAPRALLAQGRFQSYLSHTAELEKPSEPRWGVALLGACGRSGCAPGAAVLFPPVQVFGRRLEGLAGLTTGPGEASLLAGVGTRW